MAAPFGSTPKILQFSFTCFIAEATPLINPPPPIETITASSVGILFTNSNPMPAVPREVLNPSNGCIKVLCSSSTSFFCYFEQFI